ncbi:MAG: hypothetical protein OXQ84_05725 [bacterium]|nr:hypothetical protein [bacterium]
MRWGVDQTVSADAVRLALALDRPIDDCVYLALAHRIGATTIEVFQSISSVFWSSESRSASGPPVARLFDLSPMGGMPATFRSRMIPSRSGTREDPRPRAQSSST